MKYEDNFYKRLLRQFVEKFENALNEEYPEYVEDNMLNIYKSSLYDLIKEKISDEKNSN